MRPSLPAFLAMLLPLQLAAGCAASVPPGAQGARQAVPRDASSSDDPVAAKLALWLRAGTEGGASAAEIDGFLRANPDWPGAALRRRRLQQALAVEPDQAVAARLCIAYPPDTTPSLLRCAIALSPPGSSMSPASLPPAIAAEAVAAWVAGMDAPLAEAEFERLFGALPSPAQQWQRFDRQEWSGALAAAGRQITRLPASYRPLAAARLALHHGDQGASALAASLRGAAARDPAMLLELARWERRRGNDDAALALWHGQSLAAEHAAPPSRRPAFWSERQTLARDMLDQHRDTDALFLAQDDVQTQAGPTLDANFLAGWITLRRLHQPAAALPHFEALTRTSRSLITTSRGFYWAGRAFAALGLTAQARDAWTQAALRPTTFYGQAAIRLLEPGDAGAVALAIRQARDPAWSQDAAIRFAGLELARAATLLVGWNDPHDARGFLLTLAAQSCSDSGSDLGSDPGSDRDLALDAAFALRLGLADVAVAVARRAGQHGLLLARSGWPAPYMPPAAPQLPAGLALAVIRQESSFDPRITSPAGAEGLMQLMPATARLVAASPVGAGALFDPATNMALGTRYLASLLQQFAGSVPEAVAAYNAGPNRARLWVQQNGQPSGAADTIDWIELIPYGETRNYVQRVMESMSDYTARLGRSNDAG